MYDQQIDQWSFYIDGDDEGIKQALDRGETRLVHQNGESIATFNCTTKKMSGIRIYGEVIVN
ncbi:hypothetical protein [Jeotgalibacillus soli]|uniref:Uncharacterized protein n=1 Tax=Jeotgalibacillus soli TaxID=889306 RepID=A0A0C2VLL4_9BACL|nr:hypothetical protein [Jeotgalibacillus soli]KIL45356.1 hypothetical protein KP78_29000 [Jeotgalibacillus soli]